MLFVLGFTTRIDDEYGYCADGVLATIEADSAEEAAHNLGAALADEGESIRGKIYLDHPEAEYRLGGADGYPTASIWLMPQPPQKSTLVQILEVERANPAHVHRVEHRDLWLRFLSPVEVGCELVLRATDVADGLAAENPATSTDDDSLTINVCAWQHDDGTVDVIVTGLETVEEARKNFDSKTSRVIAFRAINCDPGDKEESFRTGLSIIHGLACLDGTLHALDYLVREVFTLGRQSVTNCS